MQEEETKKKILVFRRGATKVPEKQDVFYLIFSYTVSQKVIQKYGRDRILNRLYRPEMEIMAKYHQELIFISGMGMHVKNTVTVKRSSLFFKISSAK
jgi:hypothetical protein